MTATQAQSSIETLNDGTRVLIRAIRRDDVARSSAFIETLSPSSKHFLFLGGIAELSDAALERLCAADAEHDMAYVALASDAPDAPQIGVCRYAGAAPAQGAEISVAVADAWQNKGLGKRLLTRLIEHARAHGITRLYSMDAAANSPMRKLAKQLGFAERPDPDDIRQVIYSLELR